MTASFGFQLLADAVLALHLLLVISVVGGLAAVLAGNLLGWRWVNLWWFRLAHLATIAVVAAQAWLGLVCPLTTLEMWLRARAGGPTYTGSFIEHWLQSILFWHAPAWVFIAAYTVFALAVGAAWWRFPPQAAPRRT